MDIIKALKKGFSNDDFIQRDSISIKENNTYKKNDKRNNDDDNNINGNSKEKNAPVILDYYFFSKAKHSNEYLTLKKAISVSKFLTFKHFQHLLIISMTKKLKNKSNDYKNINLIDNYLNKNTLHFYQIDYFNEKLMQIKNDKLFKKFLLSPDRKNRQFAIFINKPSKQDIQQFWEYFF